MVVLIAAALNGEKGFAYAPVYSPLNPQPVPALAPALPLDGSDVSLALVEAPALADPEPASLVPDRAAGREVVAVGSSVESIVCSAEFTWPCSWALATVQCESGGNPNAIGRELYNGEWQEFRGWWQVWNGPFDPYLNTVEAHIQYVQWQRGERMRPWPNCP